MRISDWSSDVCSSDLDGKFFEKTAKASSDYDDNYYEGSLGHTRRLPGPEYAVPNQRGIRHGFNSKHQRHIVEHSEEPEQIGRTSHRERVCQYVEITVVAVSVKKKSINNDILSR